MGATIRRRPLAGADLALPARDASHASRRLCKQCPASKALLFPALLRVTAFAACEHEAANLDARRATGAAAMRYRERTPIAGGPWATRGSS
jgi:hypothetical protein